MKYKGRVLGLPVENPWVAWAAFIIVLTYYLFTQYPDLSAWDSPLIAMVGIQGGLGHPPGYPLHTLLSVVLAHLPGIAPLSGVKLLSTVPGALLCIPMLSLADQIIAKSSSQASLICNGLKAAFVILLCVHPVFWDPATRVEVYALAAFLAAWGVARLAAALSATDESSAGRYQVKGYFIAGLALGASASVNPMVAALTASAAFLGLAQAVVLRKIRWRMLFKVIAGGLVGLIPYVWIFLVAGRTDRLVWGEPTTLSAVWDFLRARDFAQNVGTDPSTLLSHLFDWVGWAAANGTLFFIALGVAGWLLLGKRGPLGRSGPIAIVLSVLAISNNKVWVPDNPDYLGYLIGPLAVCTAGGVALVSHLCCCRGKSHRIIAGLCLIVVVGVVLFAPPAFFARTRRHDRTSRLVAIGALTESPKNGIIVAGSDHLIWPLQYLQAIEHVRPDVAVVCEGLANSSWHWKYVYRRHPKLKPFPIFGPGGKAGRVQRFLKANTDRSMAFEGFGQAYRLGFKIRGVGWMLLDRKVDPMFTEQDSAAIERAAAAIGTGSPNGVGVLSLVSYIRGQALWRLGQPKAAYRALLAGVPPSMRPSQQPTEIHWEDVPPLNIWIPSGLSAIGGLGEPHRNLSLAQYLVEPEKMEQLRELESHTPP